MLLHSVGMSFERTAVVSLAFLLAAGCSSSSGDDAGGGAGPGSSGSSGGSGDGSGGNEPDATTSSGSGGSADSGSNESGSGSSGGSSASGSSGGGSDASDASAGGAAGGTAAIAAFCAAGCSRASQCAAMVDAGQVDVPSCTSTCESQNSGEEVLYRQDFWAADTSCVSGASCTDTLSGAASTKCLNTTLAMLNPDSTVIAFCTALENQSADGGCLSPAGCLASYKAINDATVAALSACIASPTFCSDPDAGQGCIDTALTP